MFAVTVANDASSAPQCEYHKCNSYCGSVYLLQMVLAGAFGDAEGFLRYQSSKTVYDKHNLSMLLTLP